MKTVRYHVKIQTMKNITLTIFLLISTITCFGQTLFFDNLNNSAWTSASNITDSTIRNTKEIPLGKLSFSKDSLKTNVTIWNFKDGLLTIMHYHYQLKAENIVATYKYETNIEKGILKITLDDKKTLEYKVGIVSTGNFALLMKRKVKK